MFEFVSVYGENWEGAREGFLVSTGDSRYPSFAIVYTSAGGPHTTLRYIASTRRTDNADYYENGLHGDVMSNLGDVWAVLPEDHTADIDAIRAAGYWVREDLE